MDSIENDKMRKGARLYLVRSLIAPILLGALYFLSAGNISNARAWIYFILFSALSSCANGILYVKKPELLYHRSKIKADSKVWDKWLMPLAVVTGFHIQSIVMGLDDRFGWSTIGQLLVPGRNFIIYCFFFINNMGYVCQ